VTGGGSAEEAQHGVRATTIFPDFVATDMVAGVSVPPSEMIQPDDIARTIAYLLDLSPHILLREIVVERTGVL
jgi:NADP-dependent 3-hydroxy acid dehydrogenase YdfG